MSDSYVQVAVDGAGKKIDNAALQRQPADPAWDATQGDTVYRQRTVIGSDESPDLQVEVRGEAGRGELAVHDPETESILGVLIQIRDMLAMALRA